VPDAAGVTTRLRRRARRLGPFPAPLVAAYGLLLACAGVTLAVVAGGAAMRAFGSCCVVLGAGCVLLACRAGLEPRPPSSGPVRVARLAPRQRRPGEAEELGTADSPVDVEHLASRLAIELEVLQRLLDDGSGHDGAPPIPAAPDDGGQEESDQRRADSVPAFRATVIFVVALVLGAAWRRSHRPGH
jgi:hypothetical protein